jgi:release factor glutamine methyltransferase|tara:strand:+ start:2596 stop:3324 length:729 start_codon:yes stop_codon:yes gene_type:complete
MTQNVPLIQHPNRVLQILVRGCWRLYRPFLLPRVRRPVIERVDGFCFVVIPTVFNPVVFRAGVMLGRAAGRIIPAAGEPDKTMLDMGCGTGIVGAYAARSGFRVTSVDINPDAVKVAKANASLNDQADRITVLEGDLFAPLASQKFDLVCFGPPYFKGPPKDDPLSKAFWSEGVIARFCRALPDHLTPNGLALIHMSTDGDDEGFLESARDAGFDISVFARKNYLNEIMSVYELRLPRRAAA